MLDLINTEYANKGNLPQACLKQGARMGSVTMPEATLEDGNEREKFQ
jgi:hypothetical protein